MNPTDFGDPLTLLEAAAWSWQFNLKWNISKSTGWIAIEFCEAIYNSPEMNLNYLGFSDVLSSTTSWSKFNIYKTDWGKICYLLNISYHSNCEHVSMLAWAFRFLPFLKYNGAKWCSKCVGHGPQKYMWKTVMSLSRNHDPIADHRHYCWVFQMYFLGCEHHN